MRLVYGEDVAVAGWVAQRLGIVLVPPYVALGIVDDEGHAMGGVVFNGFNGANIDVTVAGETRAFTRGVIRALFRYPFIQLGCRRVTVRTARRNRKVRKLAPRLGFTFEGPARCWYGNDDALVFGMTQPDCKWI